MKRLIPVLILAGALCSCGEREAPPPAPSAPAPAPAPSVSTAPVVESDPEPDPTAAEAPHEVLAEIHVVNPQGAPLADMMPIASATPNAFDTPVARGALTDGTGTSRFMVPNGQRLYIRAWDPNLEMFPANFFTVEKGQGTQLQPMQVVMAPAAVLEATVLTPDRWPAASQKVEAMLIHSDWGPWWPTEGVSDGTGRVRFPPIPPGEYEIAFRVEGIGQVRAAAVSFAPGERVRVEGVLLERP